MSEVGSGGRQAATQHVRWAIEMQRRPELDAASSAHASINNPAWFHDGEPTPARSAFHDQLIGDLRIQYPNALREKRALVLAGPPGAGKSRITADRGRDGRIPNFDPDTFVSIDADHFKERLLTRALADGSYQDVIKPGFVKALEADGEVFSPLEMASLVHEESSMLAKQARRDLVDEGYNVVIDTVLSSESSARDVGALLSSHGYSVTVVDVEVPSELSKDSVKARWEEGYTGMLSGDPQRILGGRWVPSEYVDTIFRDGQSQPRLNAENLAQEHSNVVAYQVYERSSATAAAELVVNKRRPTIGAVLEDRSTAEPTRDSTRAAELSRLSFPRAGKESNRGRSAASEERDSNRSRRPDRPRDSRGRG